MLELFIRTIIIFLPAWIGNGAPGVGAQVPLVKRLYKPVSPRFLGKHKTWGGYLVAIVISILVAWGLSFFVSFYHQSPFMIGILFGAAAMIGDSFGSLVKRKIGYAPGETCWLLDFVDWLPLCWVVAYFVINDFQILLIPMSFLLIVPTFLISGFATLTSIKENF